MREAAPVKSSSRETLLNFMNPAAKTLTGETIQVANAEVCSSRGGTT